MSVAAVPMASNALPSSTRNSCNWADGVSTICSASIDRRRSVTFGRWNRGSQELICAPALPPAAR